MFLSVVILGRFTTETHAMALLRQGPTRRHHLHHSPGRSLPSRPAVTARRGWGTRRTDVVGVFPNPAALLRLAGSVLVEAHDEWQVADKRYLSETSLALLDVSDQSAETIAPTAALTA